MLLWRCVAFLGPFLVIKPGHTFLVPRSIACVRRYHGLRGEAGRSDRDTYEDALVRCAALCCCGHGGPWRWHNCRLALLRACGGWHAEQWRVPLRDSFSGPRCSRCTHEPPLLWCAPRLRAWHGSGEHPFILDNAWDVSRALDYLASRPDVDATRMGASGVSMGGMIAWFAAAADERLAAVAPLIGVQHFGCVACWVCVCACACVRAT